jgi:hypothetical protein
MFRKRRTHNPEVYTWKSRLNLGGKRMQCGVTFEESYSPVVSWSTICLFLVIATVNNWNTIQIDFIMAYIQAPIARPTYIEFPPGVSSKVMSKYTHCLKVFNKIYGRKESGRIWYSTSKTP